MTFAASPWPQPQPVAIDVGEALARQVFDRSAHEASVDTVAKRACGRGVREGRRRVAARD